MDALKHDRDYDEDHIDEASGDRNDDDRERARSTGHSQRASSGGGPGISEAQVREVAKRVVARLRRVQHPNTKQ